MVLLVNETYHLSRLSTVELGRLMGAQLCVHACMAGTRVAAPLLALRDGYNPAAIGMLLALFSVSQVFLALPAGRLADRHGLRKPIGLSIAAAALGAGLSVASPTFPMLCLTALLSGAAAGSTMIALQRHVGRMASGRGELRRAFSWMAIGPSISTAIGALVAGVLIDRAGYRTAFLAMALLPLCGWWLVRAARELPRTEQSLRGSSASAWDLLREPVFRRLMAVNWLQCTAWEMHGFLIPLLGHDRGLSASVIGTILAGFGVATAVVRFALPLVGTRAPEWALITFSMISSAVLFVVYPLVDSAVAIGYCSVLLGLVLGMVQPSVLTMLHQVTPEHRHGAALGLRLMIINAANTSMPLLFGAAGGYIGVAAMFWTVAAALGGGTRIALKFRCGRAT